jgi:hypothetical protein
LRRRYVDDGNPSPSDIANEKSKEFWLELANQRLAGLRGGSDDDDAKVPGTDNDTRQPGEPFSEVEAQLIVSAARERLEAEGVFQEIDSRTKRTVKRVLAAFREARVGSHMFGGTDGYGHGDLGREKLDEIYAQLFGAEAALVRIQCFSGTHAIACALFAVLRPGNEMLAISGKPYDTLEEVIGSRKEDPELEPYGMTGSLDDFGVTYKEIDLLADGSFDLDKIEAALANPNTRLVHIQRSCGYQWRPSIPVHKIGEVIAFVKQRRDDVVVSPPPYPPPCLSPLLAHASMRMHRDAHTHRVHFSRRPLRSSRLAVRRCLSTTATESLWRMWSLRRSVRTLMMMMMMTMMMFISTQTLVTYAGRCAPCCRKPPHPPQPQTLNPKP